MSAAPCTRIFNIGVGAPFLTSLVEAILQGQLFENYDMADPFALSRITIYLPNRRAARAMRDAFLAASNGQTLLLPRILPLGEADQDSLFFEALESGSDLAQEFESCPSVSGLKRSLVLAQMTQPWLLSLRTIIDDPDLTPPISTAADAVALAQDLARLMDEMEAEQVSFEAFDTLIPDDLSKHWSLTLSFLKIATTMWPQWLHENALLAPAAKRNLMLESLSKSAKAGLKAPVIIAGSTGSLAATAQFMNLIGRDPLGAVVLPGLDRSLDEEAFASLTQKENPDCAHPQYGLAKLIKSFGCKRQDIIDLKAGNAARASLIAEVMRPAETLEAWAVKTNTVQLGEPAIEAAKGLCLLEANSTEEEALSLALAMRHSAETKSSALLITPDRALAWRVSMHLGRWGLEVDDSAGQPLSQTPPGIFLRLLATAFGAEFEPHAYLAVLKHPLCRLGLPATRARRGARVVELVAMRSDQPFLQIAELLRFMRQRRVDLASDAPPRVHSAVKRLSPKDWEDGLLVMERLLGCYEIYQLALSEGKKHFLPLVNALRTAAETMTQTETGAVELYQREAGVALDRFMVELCQIDDLKMDVRAADLASLLSRLMGSVAVRKRRAQTHSLQILGLLEARLQSADLVLLAGLSDGVWPDVPQNDAFLSRPMRAGVGLEPPERRVGLAAHDFTQGLSAPRVIVSRAKKDGSGSPSVPSRWWQRLKAYGQGRGLEHYFGDKEPYDWLALARQMHAFKAPQSYEAPRPCPPVAARPRRLSVTRIEEWQRNPYGIYARHILGLEPLAAVDVRASTALRGTLVHAALEAFARQYPDRQPPDMTEAMLEAGRAIFAALPKRGDMVFWWPRFERALRHYAPEEEKLFEKGSKRHVELNGSINFETSSGQFTLTGRADRIDQLPDGRYRVIDYKTGSPPRKTQVSAHFNPQLSLEAAMLARGGFAASGLPKAMSQSLVYVGLMGGSTPYKLEQIDEDVEIIMDEAFEGLKQLVGRFEHEATPYQAMRRTAFNYTYDDYAHLARVKEWFGTEDGEDGDYGDA